MPAIEICPDVFWVGVNDRTTDLFEGIWPITQEGVSYNAYLVRDEKRAIIDLAKAFKTDEFFDQVSSVIPLSALDYIVLNHMEPDHTGVLRMLLRLAPQAALLGSEKTGGLLKAFYGITENFRPVQDGETLPLGRRTLQFFSTPFLHWPETIMTYETTHRILFSCDGFGGYGALRGGIFDDECTDLAFYEKEALRYYANIIAKFSRMVLRAIERLGNLPIAMVAPSHGLIWRRDPGRILELYRRWAGYAAGPGEAGVALLYGSMYGHTEKMMNAVAQGISRQGLPLEILDVTRTHVSYILPALWIYRGVVIGAPTYEAGLFPPMAHVLDMARRKGIRNKRVARFGSYGWSGGAQKEFEALAQELGWEVLDSLEWAGAPSEEDLKRGLAFGTSFARSLLSTP